MVNGCEGIHIGSILRDNGESQFAGLGIRSEIYVLIRIKEWKKFILQADFQCICEESGVLGTVNLLITAYLVSAASGGKSKQELF